MQGAVLLNNHVARLNNFLVVQVTDMTVRVFRFTEVATELTDHHRLNAVEADTMSVMEE